MLRITEPQLLFSGIHADERCGANASDEIEATRTR